MTDTPRPQRSRRLRSPHIALGLLALIVISACGSVLVSGGGLGEPSSDAVAALGVDDLARRSLADDLPSESSVAGAGTAVAGPGAAADELRIDAEADGRAAGDDAMIVRTASLELEVEDVATALLDARGSIAVLGGYVSASDEYDQGEDRWARVSYRVPVERFTEAIDAVRGLSDRVVRESTQSQEVTATVVDMDARITNLRASESALVEIMDRSGRIEDVLAVQVRLEDVRGQIERLQAQRDGLADQAALSTLSVTWFTPVAAVAAAQQGWSLAGEIDAALAQTVQALQRAVGIGVWLAVVVLPVVGIPLLLVVALSLLLWRRLRVDRHPDGPATGAAATGE